MATVQKWTGLEARALRHAMRKSVRGFAEHLGVAVNTVSKWEQLLATTTPNTDSQAILDTALARADVAVKERYESLMAEQGLVVRRRGSSVPRRSEYETWSDDLERAVIGLSRQEFSFPGVLLDRWLQRVRPQELDERGRYLYARSLALSGDLRRLQGSAHDLMAAKGHYLDAHSLYVELGIPRRAAQIELVMTVVAEMSGRLTSAASRYEALAADERLSCYDRSRARLWIGTALSKQGLNEPAIRIMQEAAREFDELVEPREWAVAQQKLALAHRGAGKLRTALRYIETARTAGSPNSPLERVQLDTAHGHILLTDHASFDEGEATLAQAAATAGQHGLAHQLRSISNIRKKKEFS